MPTQDKKPLRFARFISWVSLVLILCTSTTLSVVIARNASNTLIEKQRDFALLMAENANHQIFLRFVWPAYKEFKRVALRQPVQHEWLDQVVRSTIHGMNIDVMRIYDHNTVVSYSTDTKEQGNTTLASAAVPLALRDGKASFIVDAKIPEWQAMFMPKLAPKSFILRTITPLRSERALWGDNEPIIGALEFTQDITADYQKVFQFLWLIIGASMLSALVLFVLLVVIVRRAEQALNERFAEKSRLERELHQNEKMASMGRMVASIAHEIRNPLGIISSSAELLLHRAKKEDELTYKILTAIFDEAKRLGHTLNDFLDYARPKSLKREQVDMANVLNDALAFQESEFTREHLRVERHYEEGLFVSGDKALLYRAVYNVIANALQALQSAGLAEGAGAVHIYGKIAQVDKGDEQIVLEIADTGLGFPTETRDKLLDPFYTTKDAGTGLGLPIVNNIITSHNGHIELDDFGGGGALVRIILPKA